MRGSDDRIERLADLRAQALDPHEEFAGLVARRLIDHSERAGLLRLKSDSYRMSNGQIKVGRSRFAKYRARVESMNRKVDAGKMTNLQRFESMRRLGVRRTTFSAHEIVMPRRQFIPDVNGRGMPRKWRDEFHATVKEAIAEILR